MILTDKKLLDFFYEKELQKTNEKEFGIEKLIKRKGKKLYAKWKSYDNSFKSWIDKKWYSYIKWVIFQNGTLIKQIESELDLSNHAKKPDLKNVTGADSSQFAQKYNLANLKSDVDRLDIGKWKTTPVDLSKLSNGVNNDVVKKDMYNIDKKKT